MPASRVMLEPEQAGLVPLVSVSTACARAGRQMLAQQSCDHHHGGIRLRESYLLRQRRENGGNTMFANTWRTGCRILLVLSLASPAKAVLDTPGVEPSVPAPAAAVDAATPVAAAETLPNPILFVTQVPLPSDFTTVASVFGNHQGGSQWLRGAATCTSSTPTVRSRT